MENALIDLLSLSLSFSSPAVSASASLSLSLFLLNQQTHTHTRRRLRAQLGAYAADESLLSHTVEEALAFDRRLDREAGYAECPARFPHQTWPRCG